MLATRMSPYMPSFFANSIRRELDEAFNQVFGGSPGHVDQSSPHLPLTLWGDDEHLYVHADVPGFDRESLDIVYRDGQLRIRGERKVAREDGRYWHNERLFGQFERALSIPDSIDPNSIEAELNDGVLAITLTKKPEAQPTKIAIKAASEKRLPDVTKNE